MTDSNNLLELKYNNYVECSFLFTIKYSNDRFCYYSKVLKYSHLLCCECDDPSIYDIYEITADTLDELINTMSDEQKQLVKFGYKVLKTDYPDRYISSDLGMDILEQITGVNKNDRFCKTCDWFGPKNKYLELCPSRTTCCQLFYGKCKRRVKVKRKDADHVHICQRCDYEGNNIDFAIHIGVCERRCVSCKDCGWMGNYNNREEHDCVSNPQYKSKKYMNKYRDVK